MSVFQLRQGSILLLALRRAMVAKQPPETEVKPATFVAALLAV